MPGSRSATWRRLAPAAALLLCCLALPATAAAGGPGSWTPVGTSGQLNISDLASLARTGDGALHVAWHRRTAAGAYDLLTTTVAPSGAVGASVPVVSGWSSVEGPSLLARGDGLSIFWSGTPTLVTGNPQDGIDMATSGDRGATWSVAPSAIATGDFVLARDAGVTAVGGGFLQAWYAGEETVVHAGLDKATPQQRGYGSGANQSMASDGTGALVAWCTGVQGANGVFVQPVAPASGAPAGAAALMPGSTVVRDGVAETFCPASARVPLVARAGGGYFVVSTDANRRAVRVWRAGAPSSMTLASGDSFKQYLALAAAPQGRLWAGWIDGGKLVLRRSNKAATVFGAAVTMAGPPGDGGVSQLDLAGQGDRVDAVARTQAGDGTVALYHAQSYPGLTVTATGGRHASFRVLDAGDPVAGAKLKVAGRTLTTDGRGRATASLTRGRYLVTASKPRYVAATTHLRVKR
jgi:hypothetical protein